MDARARVLLESADMGTVQAGPCKPFGGRTIREAVHIPMLSLDILQRIRTGVYSRVAWLDQRSMTPANLATYGIPMVHAWTWLFGRESLEDADMLKAIPSQLFVSTLDKKAPYIEVRSDMNTIFPYMCAVTMNPEQYPDWVGSWAFKELCVTDTKPKGKVEFDGDLF